MDQTKAIFGTGFGGKGFVLTNSVLCSLESKLLIHLNSIAKIIYSGTYCLIISNDNHEVKIDLSAEKPATIQFLLTCLMKIVKRYGSMQEKYKDDKDISTIFCPYCGN